MARVQDQRTVFRFGPGLAAGRTAFRIRHGQRTDNLRVEGRRRAEPRCNTLSLTVRSAFGVTAFDAEEIRRRAEPNAAIRLA